MPKKSKQEYNSYMKTYMRNKREKAINKRYYALLIQEFNEKSILPKHIYEYKIVMKQMLLQYFKKKVLKIRKNTEIITQSYTIYNSGLTTLY